MKVAGYKLRVTNYVLRFACCVLMAGLVSCMRSQDCSSVEIFCAGLVTDTLGIDDNGMNREIWAGLQEAVAGGIIDHADFIESVDARDYDKNIAYFVEHEYDVIITNGIGMRDATIRAADLSSRDLSTGEPAPVFIGMDQPFEESRPNLISITFPEDQMGFVAGALAAKLSETGIVGGVCETSGIDAMWRYCEGFRAGAEFTDPTINVQVIYREDEEREKLFIDEEWGYAMAKRLIKRGADVIFAAGGVTGQGALQAVNDLSFETGIRVYAVGAEQDQGAVLAGSGSRVVTSVLGSVRLEVQRAMRLLREGESPAPGSGQITFMPLNEKFPESWTRELEILLGQLQNGEVATGVPAEKP
ncbi:MAG: BMP family ABC transporter substrate-binding protein [Chloroflexi bacterium]|nr:BMP family ABC transporter substrate-binding protein [Chloroflexota bacterium]